MHCGRYTDHQDASKVVLGSTSTKPPQSCWYELWSLNKPLGCEQSCLEQHFNQTAANVFISILTGENLELLRQWIDIKQQPTHILFIEKLIYGQVH